MIHNDAVNYRIQENDMILLQDSNFMYSLHFVDMQHFDPYPINKKHFLKQL